MYGLGRAARLFQLARRFSGYGLAFELLELALEWYLYRTWWRYASCDMAGYVITFGPCWDGAIGAIGDRLSCHSQVVDPGIDPNAPIRVGTYIRTWNPIWPFATHAHWWWQGLDAPPEIPAVPYPLALPDPEIPLLPGVLIPALAPYDLPVAPGAPSPTPRPIPRRALPHLRPPTPARHERPWRQYPGGQTGPERSRGRPDEQPQSGPEVRHEPGKNPQIVKHPPPHERRPPDRGKEKEKKFDTPYEALRKINRYLIGPLTEGFDLIDAAYYAIDKSIRGRTPRSPQEKLKFLWDHVDDIDGNKFLDNIIENEVKDRLLGRLMRAGKRSLGKAIKEVYGDQAHKMRTPQMGYSRMVDYL